MVSTAWSGMVKITHTHRYTLDQLKALVRQTAAIRLRLPPMVIRRDVILRF